MVTGCVNTVPFPHLIADNWFVPDALEACLGEFPEFDAPGWRRYGNDHECKFEGPPVLWGVATQAYFDMLAGRAGELAGVFGLPELHMETIGGGYHLIPPGGFLDVHSDFSRSPRTGRFRRVNVLTFLNKGWRDGDGGHLELWDDHECAVEVAPEFGTTVAFVTSASSWHGHPAPTKRWRASLAAYFFTDEAPDGFREQSTVWHPNGGRRA